MIQSYSRNLGIIGVFSILGFFYLIIKKDRSLNELLIIFFVLTLLPFILIVTYLPGFIAIFIYVLAGFGLFFVYETLSKKTNYKTAIIIILIIISISLPLSAYYQINHPSTESETTHIERYFEEDTYDAGLWLKYYCNEEVIFSNDGDSSNRISSVMYIKQFPGSDSEQLMNGYIKVEEVDIERVSPTSPYFWSESYYKIESKKTDLKWIAYNLKTKDYSNTQTKSTLDQYGIKYIIENNKLLKDNENENDHNFFVTLNNDCYKLYDNDRISVWFV
jgi:hypothetical protein